MSKRYFTGSHVVPVSSRARRRCGIPRNHGPLARDNIRKVEVLEYPELGMEAVRKTEVEDFPAFIVVDDKGNDFFGRL